MGTLAVAGRRTTIVQELMKLLPPGEDVREWPRYQPGDPNIGNDYAALEADRHVLATGILWDNPIMCQPWPEIKESLFVNLILPVKLCEAVIRSNPRARICVVGSESGIKGSYDTTYALAKAALHRYVETRRVGAHQQLVCVAPTIIWDSGMTQRRKDKDLLSERAKSWPKGRLLMAAEVAAVIYALLYVASDYMTNVVVPIDGGNRATMTAEAT